MAGAMVMTAPTRVGGMRVNAVRKANAKVSDLMGQRRYLVHNCLSCDARELVVPM